MFIIFCLSLLISVLVHDRSQIDSKELYHKLFQKPIDKIDSSSQGFFEVMSSSLNNFFHNFLTHLRKIYNDW